MENEDSELLQSFLRDGKISSVDIDIAKNEMKKRKEEKLEKEVCEIHPYKISQLTITKRGQKIIVYQTIAKWEKSGKIRRQNYIDIIHDLAHHYKILCPDDDYSIGTIFELAVTDYDEKMNAPERTIRKFHIDYNRFFLKYEINKKDIRKIDEGYLDRYTHTMIASEAKRGVPVTDKAFCAYKGVLNLIFKYALRTHIIPVNPVLLMIPNAVFAKSCVHRNPTSEQNILSDAETTMLETEIRRRMTMPMYNREDGYYLNGYTALLSKVTGMRAGELCALKWADVQDDCIHIHAQILYDKRKYGGWYYSAHTKNETKHEGYGRDFPMFQKVKTLLDEIQKVQNELGIQSEFILAHKDGRNLLPDCYEVAYEHICKDLGFSVTNNHALRKSLNSNEFVPDGIDVVDRAAMLGHTIETNIHCYTFAGKDYITKLLEQEQEHLNNQKEEAVTSNITTGNLISFSKAKELVSKREVQQAPDLQQKKKLKAATPSF